MSTWPRALPRHRPSRPARSPRRLDQPARRGERPAASCGAEGSLPAPGRAGRAGPASYALVVSTLRARCPDCRTLTAVALEGGENATPRTVLPRRPRRVPKAWGEDGESAVEAAFLEPPYSGHVVDEDTLTEQTCSPSPARFPSGRWSSAAAAAHVGAVEALATRAGRLGIAWSSTRTAISNTPESLPSGNPWDATAHAHRLGHRWLQDNLVGARSLDPPEETFIAESGLRLGEKVSPRRSTVLTPSTSRSTATCSSPTAAFPCSCRSREG